MSVYSSTNRSGSTHSSGSAFGIHNQDPQSGSTNMSWSTYGSGSAIRSGSTHSSGSAFGIHNQDPQSGRGITYRIKTFDEKVKEIEQKFIKDTRVQEAEFQKNLAIIEQKYTKDTAEQERAYRRAIKKLRARERKSRVFSR